MPHHTPHHHARNLTRDVIASCTDDHAFALAGVCSLKPSAFTTEFRNWLADGKQGTMDYLERNLDLRLDPSLMLEGARSAIVVGDLYSTRAANTDELLEPGQGRIARYARGRDYHKLIKKRLHTLADTLAEQHPGHTFRAAVDTAPVLERELSSRAGLGWIGKHTLTIHPAQGSYMLLGVLLTTLDLEPEQSPTPDHCGTCTKCIQACPTDAITPYSVDGTKCISYLTIEHRDQIEPQLQTQTGDWVFGCDICQEVCPHNSPKPASATTINEAYKPTRDHFDLLEILNWDEDARREAFTRSSMKRATLAMMKRNALIVLANQLQTQPNDPTLDRIREISTDDSEPELVRSTAIAVLNRLA